MNKLLDEKTKTDKRKRSLLKSVTFRIIVILSDSIVVSLVTGRTDEILPIVIFTNISSTILYYLHERFWNKISWLRNKKSIDQEYVSRSLVKSITFRTIVLTSDFIISTLITKSSSEAIGIIIFTNISSTVIYFIHERVWNNVSIWRYNTSN
ncbi:MAG: DUF2061 domain-containing protein [Candidatus Dojkabacteria bacterium]